MRIYRFIGLLITIAGWPVLRLVMWRSKRSYVVVKSANQILVLKTWLGVKSVWRLPGGGHKSQEKPSSAALRELLEETGIKLEASLLDTIGKPPFKSRWSFEYWLYSAELSKKPGLNINKIEIIDAQWLSADELANQPCSEELVKALKTI